VQDACSCISTGVYTVDDDGTFIDKGVAKQTILPNGFSKMVMIGISYGYGCQMLDGPFDVEISDSMVNFSTAE